MNRVFLTSLRMIVYNLLYASSLAVSIQGTKILTTSMLSHCVSSASHSITAATKQRSLSIWLRVRPRPFSALGEGYVPIFDTITIFPGSKLHASDQQKACPGMEP